MVRYHVHKILPSVPVLRQINPCNDVLFYFLNTNFNVLLLSNSSVSKLSFSFRLFHKYSVFLSPCLQHSLSLLPLSSICICEPNNIWWGVKVMKLLLMGFSPFSCYFLPLGPNSPPRHPILKNPQPFDFMFQLNAPFLYYIYHIPLHVSSNFMLIIRRIHCMHTASGSSYVTLLRWPLSAQAVSILFQCEKPSIRATNNNRRKIYFLYPIGTGSSFASYKVARI